MAFCNFPARARLLAPALLLLCAASAQDGFFLKDGDRVVFYGDSITDQRLYTTFAESYAVTRFPTRRIAFVHSGWGGDRVSGGGGGPIEVRLKRDVFPYRPTVMTIMLGMNDARSRAFDPAIFQTFAEGYRGIVQAVKKQIPGIRITAIEPSPYDDVTRPPLFEGGYNAVLVRYGEFIRELAGKEGLHLADLNGPVVAALQKAKSLDPEAAARLIPDRVHPGPGGHLLMAAALLRAWSAPAEVASVEIDAAQKRVVAARNARVEQLQTDGGVSWTQQDSALPMPIDSKDPLIALAVRSSDVMDSLNRQSLRLAGLKGANYTLKIDGEEIGAFTPAQLAAGVNLAAMPTPMMKQSLAVHALTLKHNNIHFARWRLLQVPLQDDNLAQLQAAMESLDRLEAELVARQREAAQPRPHRYSLTEQ